jgi:hypothetical protein
VLAGEPTTKDQSADSDSIRTGALFFCLSMISAQTLRVCREGKPVSTFPDHALVLRIEPYFVKLTGLSVNGPGSLPLLSPMM